MKVIHMGDVLSMLILEAYGLDSIYIIKYDNKEHIPEGAKIRFWSGHEDEDRWIPQACNEGSFKVFFSTRYWDIGVPDD